MCIFISSIGSISSISIIICWSFSMDNYSLRNSPQNFHHHCADKCQNPGSRNSLAPSAGSAGTVGFHNFNLRIFNLRVSNPNKLIVDVFLT